MSISVSLSPEIEAWLRREAAATGKDLSTLVQEAVAEKLGGTAGAAQSVSEMPFEHWAARFDAWVAGHKPVGHFVDDDRESIYAGRGE